MTDKELEQKSDDLMRLFFSFCDEEEGLTESGEYLLAAIKKWLKDNVIEVEWEGEKARLWTPWTKN
jgi:hypothetical protein